MTQLPFYCGPFTSPAERGPLPAEIVRPSILPSVPRPVDPCRPAQPDCIQFQSEPPARRTAAGKAPKLPRPTRREWMKEVSLHNQNHLLSSRGKQDNTRKCREADGQILLWRERGQAEKIAAHIVPKEFHDETNERHPDKISDSPESKGALHAHEKEENQRTRLIQLNRKKRNVTNNRMRQATHGIANAKRTGASNNPTESNQPVQRPAPRQMTEERNST